MIVGEFCPYEYNIYRPICLIPTDLDYCFASDFTWKMVHLTKPDPIQANRIAWRGGKII